MRRIRLAAIAGAVMAIVVFCLLTYRANALFDVTPDETYRMGDWAPFEDGYLIDQTIEHLDGYSLQIIDAEIMTPREYLSAYAKDGATELGIPEDDVPCVLAVTISLHNEGNTDGVVSGYLWRIIPASLNKSYSFDTELFEHVGGVGDTFKVSVGGEATATFAFVRWEDTPYFSRGENIGMRRAAVDDRSFHLTMSMKPVRRLYEFCVS